MYLMPHVKPGNFILIPVKNQYRHIRSCFWKQYPWDNTIRLEESALLYEHASLDIVLHRLLGIQKNRSHYVIDSQKWKQTALYHAELLL